MITNHGSRLDKIYTAINLNHTEQEAIMVKAKRLIKASIAVLFVYGMTVVGYRIDEPVMGLIALGLVILYFKADFSK